MLYDPAVTTPDELCAELERMTGFVATVVESSPTTNQTQPSEVTNEL